MITLALLKQMANDNVANLVIDKNLFWEEMPLQKDGKPASGVWLVTRGGSAGDAKGHNQRSTVDFYVALANKPQTEAVHQAILRWIIANPCFCVLSGSVGSTSYNFTNVRLRPATTPQNYGATENGLIVKIASADVIYDLAKQ
ncbi:hypothetical protein IKG38_03595 [Candidatus Saccharibacteria bacterium]|jgi:hypothetical protein|nr:hypothetical protein [Candidatus Saccharibacteria bacterium]